MKLQSFRFLSKAISFIETVEEMIAIRNKNTSKKSTWEATSTRKPNCNNKTNEQPFASVVEKGKESDIQDVTKQKKKEATSKGKSQNNYTRPSLRKCFQCGQPGHLSNNCPQ